MNQIYLKTSVGEMLMSWVMSIGFENALYFILTITYKIIEYKIIKKKERLKELDAIEREKERENER